MSLNRHNDQSRIGIESNYSLDNLCGDFKTKKLFLKPKRIVIYTTKTSILAIFPFYENSEIDNFEKRSEYYNYFNKTFLQKAQNKRTLEAQMSKQIINFSQDEFIETVKIISGKENSINEGELTGITFSTNKREIEIGKTNLDSNSTVAKLNIKDQFIIGFKTCYESRYDKEFDTKIPYLIFLKIYTEENHLKGKYYKESLSSKFSKLFNLCTKLLTFIFLIISFLISYYYFSQNIYKGVLIIPNETNTSLKLNYPTKLHTDEHGFVHIKSETIDDAFYTLGIAHARDRLWQMDFVRRLSRGKLSEILGYKAFKIDKMMRNLGINKVAMDDALALKQDKILSNRVNKYIDAINFYANTHYLPPEYQLLSIKFSNWTVADTMAYGRFLTYSTNLDFPLELFNNLILNNLGEEFYKMISFVSYENYLNSDRTVISHEELEKAFPHLIKKTNEKNENTQNFQNIKNNLESNIVIQRNESSTEERIVPAELVTTHASNSWVVSGNYTASGKPILTNDPHLSNAMPSVHYVVKMYIGNSTHQKVLVGSAPAGLPYFIIGSNKNLSWGITTDNRDVSDICEEKLDNDNLEAAEYYYVGGDKLPLEEVKEVIKIKNQKSAIFKNKYTSNGPLVEEFLKEISIFGIDYKYTKKEGSVSNALSVRIIPFRASNILFTQYHLNFAEKKEDFLSIIDNYGGPLLALIWATTEGEIGYTPIGRIPLKENKDSTFCKGYVHRNESIDYITGFIPRNETPVITNPEKGYIVTANNRQFPGSYIHYSQTYAYFNRFTRVSELLNEIIHTRKEKFEPNSSIDILFDVKDLYAANLLPKLVNIIQRNFHLLPENKKEVYENYLNVFRTFDCFFYKNSTSASLYSVFEFHLGKNLLLKNIDNNVNFGFSTEGEARGIMNNFNYWNFVEYFVDKIEKGENVELENCKYYKPFSNCEGYIMNTFELLEDYMKEGNYLKENGQIKEWGDIHFQYYPHAFDTNKVLKNVFSRKIPTDGNRYTVKVSKTKIHDFVNGPFAASHSANLKFISDLSDITRPYIIIDTGNSGNILTKFYDNLMEKSENNELVKIKDHEFNDDVHLLISFPEHNTLIIRNK